MRMYVVSKELKKYHVAIAHNSCTNEVGTKDGLWAETLHPTHVNQPLRCGLALNGLSGELQYVHKYVGTYHLPLVGCGTSPV